MDVPKFVNHFANNGHLGLHQLELSLDPYYRKSKNRKPK